MTIRHSAIFAATMLGLAFAVSSPEHSAFRGAFSVLWR